ncbi:MULTISPECIES: hypothetical protein [Eisenbergiella]|uniref:hypothetical protein n=1 Tax=Eisenbergiella TaxID=1432051 RepID=UPI0023F45AA5|nr:MULTISPECIES: hypothetical protein [Eisenbergiella]MCI6707835.1 hypothetical protein [Eisenbergiella massiliensis]MDY5527713.1 hypothetical protein [Eisenbergiella porci]
MDEIRRWMSSFQRGECIIIKDLEELKESDPLEYRRLKPQNIRTAQLCGRADRNHEQKCFYQGYHTSPEG